MRMCANWGRAYWFIGFFSGEETMSSSADSHRVVFQAFQSLFAAAAAAECVWVSEWVSEWVSGERECVWESECNNNTRWFLFAGVAAAAVAVEQFSKAQAYFVCQVTIILTFESLVPVAFRRCTSANLKFKPLSKILKSQKVMMSFICHYGDVQSTLGHWLSVRSCNLFREHAVARRRRRLFGEGASSWALNAVVLYATCRRRVERRWGNLPIVAQWRMRTEGRGTRAGLPRAWSRWELDSLLVGYHISISMKVLQVCPQQVWVSRRVLCVRLCSRVPAYSLTCTWDSVEALFCLASSIESRDSEALFCLAASSRIWDALCGSEFLGAWGARRNAIQCTAKPSTTQTASTIPAWMIQAGNAMLLRNGKNPWCVSFMGRCSTFS